MDNLLAVTVKAHHQEINHHRRYQVILGRDLFEEWTVAIRHGRTGQAGTERRYASAQADDMRAVIRARLRRRLSAPRRIGCSYQLVALHAAPGLEAVDWLPREFLGEAR